MSDEIRDIIEETIGEFNLRDLIESLEPTDEEREILSRALATYASLKIKEQLGQDVEKDLKLTEATLVNLSFMNESKVRGILAPFLTSGEGLLFVLLNRVIDLVFEKIFEELNNIQSGEEETTEETTE